MADSIPKINYPELFFGFVAPIGADLRPALAAFRAYLEGRDYRVIEIKITDIFNILARHIAPREPLSTESEYKRYKTYIAYGNQLREIFQDDVLAVTAIQQIMARRLAVPGQGEFTRLAFLLHQFKRKEEIDLLRSVYGRLFFQVSIYSRRGARVDYLSRRFASSENRADTHRYRHFAEELIDSDENEVGEEHGQRVASIFHDADVILSSDAAATVKEQVTRFCELLFGSNSISPTRSEYGLYLAKAAALRTLDLSRQVGAAMFSKTGEIIALGSNEVPKATGGTYWSDDKFDDRDFVRGRDSNEQRKREIFGELVRMIRPDANPTELLETPKIRDSQFMGALEYGRVVHAEMCALSDAARCGLSVRDSTLYSTTFPCHMCAKHIVAAGVAKVVFLEPYPKSLAIDLHADSIRVEGGDRGHYRDFPAVEFEHFYGVSPRRYREIFERGTRKLRSGEFVPYRDGAPRPFINIQYPFYTQLERFFGREAMGDFRPIVRHGEIVDYARSGTAARPRRRRSRQRQSRRA